MNVGVLGDIEFDGDEAAVGDGNGRRIAGTGINLRDARRQQRVRVSFSEAAIRARHEGDGILDIHDSL